MNELEGRELDAAIAEEFFGFTYIDTRTFFGYEDGKPINPNTEVIEPYWCGRLGTKRVPYYSRDIAAAMQVVEKMRERGIHINIVSQEDGYLITASEFQPQSNCYFNVADTRVDSFEKLPEAICRAARMAVEAE